MKAGTIQVSNYRSKDGYNCPVVEVERSVLSALTQLISSELGFGGSLTQISRTQLTTRVNILNCVDTTVFQGAEWDMMPLVHFSLLTSGLVKEAFSDEGVIDALVEQCKGNAFLLTQATPVFVGKAAMKAALLKLLELPAIAKESSLEDLVVGYHLLFEGCKREQVQQLFL